MTFTRQRTELTDELLNSVYKMIKSILRTKYKTFNHLYNNPSILPEKFFNVKDDLMDIEDTFMYFIKFNNTHKRIKLFINKDKDSVDIEVMYLQKTSNIIEDISNFYIPIDTQYLNKKDLLKYPDKLKRFVMSILEWGFKNNIDRSQDIFKADGVNVDVFKKLGVDTFISKEVLYFGIIYDHEIESENNVKLFLSQDKELYISLPIAEIKPSLFNTGNLVIFNYKFDFTFMPYVVAKKHILFNRDDMKKIITCNNS